VGWCSVVIGIAGLVLHLESQFFQRWTLASLVYAAPSAAPLAYTGIGLLLIMNRSVDADGLEWPLWVIFLALGGFVGNFIFSVTDHGAKRILPSQRMDSGLQQRTGRRFHVCPIGHPGEPIVCACLCGAHAVSSSGRLGGIGLHLHADVHGVGPTLFDRIVYGAPVFAPMLFPDLVLLASIGLWVLYRRLPAL
jgi:hypothetical protein